MMNDAIIMWPPHMPHYVSCPSVCPSVPYWLIAQHKETQKNQNRHRRFLWQEQVLCQSSVRKVKGQGHWMKTSKIWWHVGDMFMYRRQYRRIKRGRCRVKTRPTPLLGPIPRQRLRCSKSWQLEGWANVLQHHVCVCAAAPLKLRPYGAL